MISAKAVTGDGEDIPHNHRAPALVFRGLGRSPQQALCKMLATLLIPVAMMIRTVIMAAAAAVMILMMVAAGVRIIL